MTIINSCPENVTKKAAILDFNQNDTGLIHCYCYNRIIVNGDYASAVKDKFQDVMKGNKEMLCGKWFINYVTQMSLSYGSVAAGIFVNLFACMIFVALGPFSRYKTLNNQTMSIMYKILIF